MSDVIYATNLKIGYSPDSILSKIDNLKIEEGEIISIVGESGIGKTTFLKNIAHLVNPISGTLKVFGTQKTPDRGAIGYIPQKLGLIKHETVFFNVLEGAICNESILRSISGFHEEEVITKVKEVIELMDLSNKIDEPIKRLSGGQQRRVAIARTMAQGPKLILADEFLSELDDKTVNTVWKVMSDYVESKNITLVIVEHNIQRAKLAKRCLKLEKEKNYSILSEMEI
ncbi:MAG: ATP-binding cassette domain-containing protein [Candidatus Poseidoniales archaeon]